jgi:hypothetical protein
VRGALGLPPSLGEGEQAFGGGVGGALAAWRREERSSGRGLFELPRTTTGSAAGTGGDLDEWLAETVNSSVMGSEGAGCVGSAGDMGKRGQGLEGEVAFFFPFL